MTGSEDIGAARVPPLGPADFDLLELAPADLDPAVTNFLAPNILALPRRPRLDIAPIVFLPGAGRSPSDERRLIEYLAGEDCRVIGLTYNNAPSIRSTCPSDPDPGCSAKLREARVFGTGGGPAPVPAAETIVARLAAVIRTLDLARPAERWRSFLASTEPAWDRLILGGHSQGGGMAALIAKKRMATRVAIFSNPADFHNRGPGSEPELSGWVGEAGVTPVDRQFALYHRREEPAALVAASLRAMGLPPGNVRVLDRDLPGDVPAGTTYHQAVTLDRRYSDSWSWIFGLGATTREGGRAASA